MENHRKNQIKSNKTETKCLRGEVLTLTVGSADQHWLVDGLFVDFSNSCHFLLDD